VKSQFQLRVLLFPLLGTLAACGSDSGGDGGGGNGDTWTPNVFLPSSQFDNMCAAPRSGTSDRKGTVADENRWLRSWTNELYLWYGEVTDRDPSAYNSALDYFDLLRTSAKTTSGQSKDKFHFTYPTTVWKSLSEGGIEAGYGAEFAVLPPSPNEPVRRHIRVAYTDPNTPAATKLFRGDEIVNVDGADAVGGNTEAIIDTLNAGLFPDTTGESHVFTVVDLAGVTRSVTLTSASVTHVPVPIVNVFDPTTDPVGYLQFNDHIATAEGPLIEAMKTFQAAHVTDLVLDIRYNGGGYLDMASELAYMIANTTLTSGRTFEKIVFNDKHPTRNPVTGETLAPTPFLTKTQGWQGQASAGQALPTLNLDRVYIIVGPGTCSASESIINSLRGVNVQVYLIGSTTCGKPYGFYPTDNCGTTYFTIQFRGENAANFGDYTDGFSPANQPAPAGTSVPGCSVADDFTHAMGDEDEARVAAARAFRASNNQTCPAASGFAPPLLSKASSSTDAARTFDVSKPAARLNRIVRSGT
jgi:carboxyl-terminal processing protease